MGADDQRGIPDCPLKMKPVSPSLIPGQCATNEHRIHRRLFLKGLGGGALASAASFAGLFHNPVFAAETKVKRSDAEML